MKYTHNTYKIITNGISWDSIDEVYRAPYEIYCGLC